MTRDEGGQHSAVLRQVTAGVVVKLTVLHDYVGFVSVRSGILHREKSQAWMR